MKDDHGRAPRVDHYTAQYGNFDIEVVAAIRAETFGEDFGQNGWITSEEQDQFISWLELPPGAEVCDVACGSGGPSLRLARRADCRVEGVDRHEDAVARATAEAARQGMSDQVHFRHADAGARLACADASFDAVICIDAINHLPDREAVLADWLRILRPGGRILFTDPIIVTGALTNDEIALRASLGFFLFVPPGHDARLVREAGFVLERDEDRTSNMATIAARWGGARARHEAALRRIEGDGTFEGQQSFFECAARIAREARLSRRAFVGRKPTGRGGDA